MDSALFTWLKIVGAFLALAWFASWIERSEL